MKQGQQTFAKFQKKMPGMAPVIAGKRAHSKNDKYELVLDSSPMNLFSAAQGGFTSSSGQQQFKVQ
jgi:hypothetical protein